MDADHPANGVPIPRRTTAVLREQIEEIERARLQALQKAANSGPHAMVRLLARIVGVGIETADMLVHEVLTRNLRDRRAVARYAGLTGTPDESGSKRREKGLAKSGNSRVRRGLIQLAWRFLRFQKNSALARWYRARTEGPKGAQDNHDRGPRPETADRALAHGNNRRRPDGGAVAAARIGMMPGREQAQFRRPVAHSHQAVDHDPRWRCHEMGHGCKAAHRNV